MRKYINNENEIKIKTIYELLSCEQNIVAFLKLQKCLKALFSNVNISMELVFKHIFGPKKKDIDYDKFYKLYLNCKNNNNNESNEIKIFFDKLLNSFLKEEYSFIGKDIKNNYVFSTRQTCRKRKCITMIQILSDKKGKIHGLILEYDGEYKSEMYPNSIKDKLIISLEIKLEIIKKNVNEKLMFDEENNGDGISHILGTINNKSGLITFLGFKSISGKTLSVGFPEGEGFLFGKFGKKLQYLKIHMTEDGINKLEPEFKEISKKNYYTKKSDDKLPNHTIKVVSAQKEVKKREDYKEGNNINKNITNRNIEKNIEQKDEFEQQYSRKRILKSIWTRRQIKQNFSTLDENNINNNKELTQPSNHFNYIKTDYNKGLTKLSIELNSPKTRPSNNIKNFYSNNKESKYNYLNKNNDRKSTKSLGQLSHFTKINNKEPIKYSIKEKYFNKINNKELAKPSNKYYILNSNFNKDLIKTSSEGTFLNNDKELTKSNRKRYILNYNKELTNSMNKGYFLNNSNDKGITKSTSKVSILNNNNNKRFTKSTRKGNFLNNYNEKELIKPTNKVKLINNIKEKELVKLSNKRNYFNRYNNKELEKSLNKTDTINNDNNNKIVEKKPFSKRYFSNKNRNKEIKKSTSRNIFLNNYNETELIKSTDRKIFLNKYKENELKNSTKKLNFWIRSTDKDLAKPINNNNETQMTTSTNKTHFLNTTNKNEDNSIKNTTISSRRRSKILNKMENSIKIVSDSPNRSSIAEDIYDSLENLRYNIGRHKYSMHVKTVQKKLDLPTKKRHSLNLGQILNNQTDSYKFTYKKNYKQLKEKLGKMIHDEFREKNNDIIQQTILNNYIPYPGSYIKSIDKEKNINLIQHKKQRVIKMKNLKGNIIILEDNNNRNNIQNKEKTKHNLNNEKIEENNEIKNYSKKITKEDLNTNDKEESNKKYTQQKNNNIIDDINEMLEIETNGILRYRNIFDNSEKYRTVEEKWRFFRKGLEKIKLYKIIEENENIIKFLCQEKPSDGKKGKNYNKQLLNNSDIIKEDEKEKINEEYTKEKNDLLEEEGKKVLININKYIKKYQEKRLKDKEKYQEKLKQEKKEGILSLGSIFTRKVSTKIYLNQKMATPFEPWHDNIFPHEKKSLCPYNKTGWIYPKNVEEDDLYGWDDIEWCPVDEMENMDNYNVFTDRVSVDDIKQGDIGDCYFFSAVGALCEVPDFFNKLFHIKKKTEEHIYGIYFFLNGEWRLVLVDDYFPYKIENNVKKFRFSYSFKNEIWVSLLEKAWAKVNGCYARIGCGGFCYEAFDVLTEAYTEHLFITKDKKEELWQIIENSIKKNYPMTAGTPEDNQILFLEYTGLEYGHAYTIINIYTVEINPGEMERLIKIKNPWGNSEFNGDWSDNSKKWTPELKEKCDFPGVNDEGIFYMSFNDFLKYFIILDIAKLEPGYRTTFCHINKEDATRCQIIKFEIEENSPRTFIQLYQKNPRIQRKNRTYYPDPVMSFILVAKLENDAMKYVNSMTSIPSLSNNEYKMHIAVEVDLSPGTYYIFCDVNYRYFYFDYKSYGYTVTFYAQNPIINFENITKTFDRRLGLELVMYDYCKQNIEPIKHETGLEIYQTENFDIKLPFKVLCFLNPTEELIKLKLDIKYKGEKLFCIYNDNIASEFDTSVIKVVKPKSEQTVLIMSYSILSRFKTDYEILLSDDIRTYENDHPVFKSKKEQIDEEGRLFSYFLKKEDGGGYTIGVENISNLDFLLKLILEGLYNIDPEFEDKKNFEFKILSKSKRVFNVRIIPDYINNISFFFDLM